MFELVTALQVRFVRSGNVYVKDGFTRYAGIGGYYWSNSGSTEQRAYNFYLGDPNINSSNGPRDRYRGFSLRCLQE